MVTNCKNCGAVIDPNLDKCPYCGTRYLDIAININDPFFIRFRDEKGQVFEAKAILKNDITLTYDTEDIYSTSLGKLVSLYTTPSATLEVSMQLLPYDNKLMTLYK